MKDRVNTLVTGAKVVLKGTEYLFIFKEWYHKEDGDWVALLDGDRIAKLKTLLRHKEDEEMWDLRSAQEASYNRGCY